MRYCVSRSGHREPKPVLAFPEIVAPHGGALAGVFGAVCLFYF
ncbi:hypothetical protein PTE31013_00877 [Pandoraea terrigena]|uniref:Uncharacterized protein n=1 Tax=Pandoraea terrigena TaxID=2508292 RepID=A0A5E4SRW5_9BURK|nr:hypothetical protein PTE31013_00877 [Pandoraea terrigena]